MKSSFITILILLAITQTACEPFVQYQPAAEIPEAIMVNYQQAENKQRFAIITHSTLDVKYVPMAKLNHAEYARRQGYDYIFRNNNIDDGKFADPDNKAKVRQLGLYWQKIQAVQDAMLEHPEYDWIFWIDADALFSNMNISFEEIIEKYGPNKNFFIATDALSFRHDVVNAGTFLIRNNAWGRDFIKKVASLHSTYKNMFTPEQQALQDLIFDYVYFNDSGQVYTTPLAERGYEDDKVIKEAVVVPQRVMNSFYDNQYLAQASARWQPGDFIVHFAVSSNKFLDMEDFLAAP